MKSLNPELENQVDALADLCCQALNRQVDDVSERARPLIQSLVQNGYNRISDVNLQVRLEKLVVEKCRETAIHRRDELTGITGQMQTAFKELATWKTSAPNADSGGKSANISSATDS